MRLLQIHIDSTLALFTAALAVPAASAQFGPRADLSDLSVPIVIESVDLDDDGDLDLIFGRDSRIATIENLGFGEFGTPQSILNQSFNSRYVRLALADLDQDGEEDLIAADRDRSNVSLFWGNAFGSFDAEVILTGATRALDVEVADDDGDGDFDVFYTYDTNSSGDGIVRIENLGGRMFAPGIVLTTAVNAPTAIEVRDYDNDGALDLATSSQGDDRIAWYRGAGDGTYGPQQVIGTGLDGPQDLASGDLDGDGRIDLVACSVFNGRVAVFRNAGGSFMNPLILDDVGSFVVRVELADFDRDGDLDVIAACPQAGEVRLYENVGFGFFGLPVALMDGVPDAQHAILLDVDGDAAQDVVSCSLANGKVYWHPNTLALGSTYCNSNPNSTGVESRITVTGTTNLLYDELTLTATDLPLVSFGFFLTSPQQGLVNMPGGSQGILCLSGQIGRYIGPGEPQFSGIEGRFRLRIEAALRPSPIGFVGVQPGETWNFQAWHRDSVNGQSTSNFTSAVAVAF